MGVRGEPYFTIEYDGGFWGVYENRDVNTNIGSRALPEMLVTNKTLINEYYTRFFARLAAKKYLKRSKQPKKKYPVEVFK